MKTATPPRTPRKFFQRMIVSWRTRRDRHGRAFIVGCTLSCGHDLTYQRLRPFPSKRTAAPCYPCGSGLRVPFDRARESSRMNRVVQSARVSQERTEHVVAALSVLREIIATVPISEAQLTLWDQAARHLHAAGVYDSRVADPEDLDA